MGKIINENFINENFTNENYISKIIRQADTNLTIVTSKLSLDENLINLITNAEKDGVRTLLIYGSKEIEVNKIEELNKLTYLEIYYYEDLRYNLYINDKESFLSTKYLHEIEIKENNLNQQLGVVFENVKERLEILEEVYKIMKISKIQKQYVVNSEEYDRGYNEVSRYAFFSEDFKGDKYFFHQILYEKLAKIYPKFILSIEKSDDKHSGIIINKFVKEDYKLKLNGFAMELHYPQEEYCDILHEKLKKLFLWDHDRFSIYVDFSQFKMSHANSGTVYYRINTQTIDYLTDYNLRLISTIINLLND